MLVAALTLSPVQAADTVVRYEASHEVMGTVFTVVVYGQDRDYLAEVVNQVFEEVDRLDGQMSNYKPESELSVINREAAQREVTVEPRLFRLIQYSVQASQESGGDFDITVGPLMKLWGFFRGQGRLPSPAQSAPRRDCRKTCSRKRKRSRNRTSALRCSKRTCRTCRSCSS